MMSSFQEPLVDVIDTNATKKPNSPQFKFSNPLKKTIFVNSIQLSFDAYFSEKGAILIKVNNNPIFSKKAGSFKRLQNITIPLKNEEFLQQQKIEIFAWNGTDTDFVSVGYDIKISEDAESPLSSDTPLSQDVRNSAISEPQILFEKKLYSADEIKLLDMKEYKKLIVNMSAADYVPPIAVGINGAVVDGDLNTKWTDPSGFSAGGETRFYSYVDFGDNLSREVHAKVGSTFANQSMTWTLQGDDDVAFPSPTDVGSITSNNGTATVLGSAQTFRYYRLKAVGNGGAGGTSAELYEIFNSLVFGGSADLSFEELDIASNTFTELIPSSEFGTVTSGQAIKKQIGDVNNVSSTGKTYFLPSTQNGLQVKLTVIGSIDTGVSIRRIK